MLEMTTQTSVQPKIVVKTPVKSKKSPVRLAQYNANVEVDGALYRVTLDMTFKNELTPRRELECEVLVPLPQGAMIDGYALDVNGALVDASAVTKEKARVALESEERRKVDPGVAEHVQGNVFRTRIYPLVDERRFRIDYVAPLELLTKDSGALCEVGMIFEEPVDDFSFEILVKEDSEESGARIAEYFQSPRAVEEWEEMGFQRSEERRGWLASFKRKNFKPSKNARVLLPTAPTTDITFERTAQGVFMLAPITLPEQERAVASASTEALDSITILWDASASRDGAGAPNSVESALLNAALKRFRPQRVRFVPFRNDVDESEIRELVAEPESDYYLAHQILDLVESTPSDGATNLTAAVRCLKKGETALLFSDGLSNWGDETVELPESGAIFTFSSGATTDAAALRRLANATGGAYFNLNASALEEVCEQIALIFAREIRPARILVRNLELTDESFDTNAKRLLVAAKVIDESRPVALDCRLGDVEVCAREYEPKKWQTLEITPRRRANIQSFFAQTRLNALLPAIATQRDEIERLGLQFELATPATSLIVLENLEQYLQHKICPPESLPEMREEYLARVRSDEESLEEKRIDRTNYVARLWNRRLEWYRTEFVQKREERASSPSPVSRARAAISSLLSGSERRESIAPQSARQLPSSAVRDEELASFSFSDEEELILESCVHSEASYMPCCDEGIDACRNEWESALENESTPSATIRLTKWEPDCDVVERLAQLSGDEQTSAYLRARREYGGSPTFFFACAEFFAQNGNNSLAIRALSNLSEASWDDQQLLRPLAKKLLALDETELAIAIFERVLTHRPEEPQSYRDLALALEERADSLALNGQDSKAIEEYRRALELLSTVIYGRNYEGWDQRFPEIEVIALEDACGIVAKLRRLNVSELPDDLELVVPLELDLRITLTWSADNTDFDLWVFEPDGNKVYYSAPRSQCGGLLSCDYRDGYGPEEYLIRQAAPGRYRIVADYFSSQALTILGEIYLEAEVVTNFGRANQSRSRLGFSLRDVKEDFEVGTVDI